MKTSDDSLLKQAIAALLIGPPGGGKTSFALQWPGLYVADCDQNLAGPMRFLKGQGKYKPFAYDRICYDDDGAPIQKLDKQWERLLIKVDAACKDPAIETIFIDSLTHIDRILYSHCLVKLNTTQLEWNQFKLFIDLLYRFIMAVRASGKNVLVACHEQIEYGPKGEIKKYKPVLSTKLAQYFGYMFTDVWRMKIVDAGAGKQKAMMYLTPTATSELKNSLLLSGEMEATYANIEAGINKTKL